MNEKGQSRPAGFIRADHRYVYPAGSFAAYLSLSLLNAAPNRFSFIEPGNVLCCLCAAVCWVFLAVSAAALAVKCTHWDSYDATFVRSPGAKKAARYLSYLMAAVFALVIADRLALGAAAMVSAAKSADSMPEGFVSKMLYMSLSQNGKSALIRGVWTTVRLALFGTAIAFVLSILMVFMRIQTPDKRDKDFVKLLKYISSKFASLYIFVIRGTPMMVQSLIIYYFFFGLFRDHTALSVTEITKIWSFFISGLVTISLNSTAYLAEVLRGGINAIDPGQMEAARSLGMTNWQAMVKVVFPQAVKNSIPAIGNEFIINIKDSAVLSIIGVMDLMGASKTIVGVYYRNLEPYCIAAVLYLVLTWLSSLLLKAISKKMELSAQGIPSSN